MVREILFRGKRLDNGEWIYGQLLYFKASVGIEEFALVVASCEWNNADEFFNLGKRAKVIPDTVGQYTGLTDKNGKKIFENGFFEINNQSYKVDFENAEFVIVNKLNCDKSSLKDVAKMGVFIDGQ